MKVRFKKAFLKDLENYLLTLERRLRIWYLTRFQEQKNFQMLRILKNSEVMKVFIE